MDFLKPLRSNLIYLIIPLAFIIGLAMAIGGSSSSSSSASSGPSEVSSYGQVVSNDVSNLDGVAGQIADFLLSKGITKEGVAAALGNIEQECGFNPKDVSDSGTFVGICQWGRGRRASLEKLASEKGTEWTDLNTQLEFMWEELCGGYKPVKENLLKATDERVSAEYFARNYEGCVNKDGSIQQLKERQDFATKWLKALKEKATSTNTNYTVTKQIGSFDYKQLDYENVPPYYNACGNWGTIKDKGCMPSSMSIIATFYSKTDKNGKPYNPQTFVEQILPGVNGKQVNSKEADTGYSTSTNITKSMNKIGLKTKEEFRTSTNGAKQKILDHLKSGNAIIIHAAPGYYTDFGHFMTLLACDGNKVYLSNPSSRSKTGWLDIDTLISRNVDWCVLISQ